MTDDGSCVFPENRYLLSVMQSSLRNQGGDFILHVTFTIDEKKV